MNFLLMSLFSLSAFAGVEVGTIAPNFKLIGHDGKQHALTDFSGKTVVLEWLNHGCPFIKKHYDSGNMQALQQKYRTKDVVWLSVISSAKGKQGHSTPQSAAKDKKQKGSNANFVLIDESGSVGKAYGAKTTPHMFVINNKGIISYAGAIDSIASADKADVPKAKNYVSMALDELLAGKMKVAMAKSRPYGCSVKY